MTADEIQIRHDICSGCREACEVRDTIDRSDPCAECPRRIWHAFGDCESQPKGLGLGDAVAFIAQPIARAVDAVTKGRTNLAGCGGCKARRARLNKIRL